MGVTNFPDGVNIGSNAGATAVWQLGGTEVATTAAELNKLDGILGNALAHDASAFQIVASGSTAITGAGTVATGLAGAAVAVVVAGLRNMGTAAGDPLVVSANPTGSGGSVIFTVRDEDGVQSTVAGTVDWIAISTAA